MADRAAVPANPPSLPAERFFRGSLLFLVFTSVGTIITTGKLDLLTCILAPAAMLFKGYRWWKGKPAELSHTTATWLVLWYLGIFPLDIFFLSRSLAANSTNPILYSALLGAIHFLLFVMLVRLYSATTDRDALFLAMLAFAGILAAAVLTIDTSFLIMFSIFLLFGVATFVAMEMRRAAKGTITPPLYAQEKRLNKALSFASASVSIGAIVLGSGLFFLFPRFSAGYMGRAGMQPSLMTGFTEDVELGQIGEIKKSSSVVMRVKTGRPVGYPMLRWRGIALSTFDGKRWTAPHRHPDVLPPNSEGWIMVPDADQQADPAASKLQYTTLLQPMATDAVFTPGQVLSLRGNFSGDGSNEWSSRHSYLFRDSTGSIFNPFHNYSSLRYLGESRLPTLNAKKLRAASSDYPDPIRRAYLQLPDDLDARIAPLAAQITAKAATSYDKTRAVEEYLRSHYRYTLNLVGTPGEDPLPHFLFDTRAGHCEYFASAMAIMLRTLGIPSREVNGFLPGEYNDLAGDYIVRASDAHSWVEAFFPGTGWVTFDPTPAAAADFGLLTRAGQYLDWLELTWNEWIINYDFAHQVQMAQIVQRNSRSWSESARTWFQLKQLNARRSLKSWQVRHTSFAILLPIALILFLAVLRFDLVQTAIRRLWLHWQFRNPQSARANPVLASRLYAELLRLLERRGLARQASQTPLEFAAALATAGDTFPMSTSGLAPAVREFTQIYAEARFGGTPCDTLKLRSLLDQIARGLRRPATRDARPGLQQA